MASPALELISWLRAAGESSRLRLLALCDKSDLSVSDMAQALGQSEPRVCRHLRILSEAGLIERVRNGQWVHYRLAASAPAASFVKGLLGQLDRQDPLFARDLQRIQTEVRGATARAASAGESKLGRALSGFFESGAPAAHAGAALVVGVDHLELLESAAIGASTCSAIAHSRRAAQVARSYAQRRGFNCQVLLSSSAAGLAERDLARSAQRFEVVVIDHLSVGGSGLERLLDYGRGALVPGGHLWVFERYESLEPARDRPRDKALEHPLARFRRLLGEAGLSCERLSPVEADDEHVLAAVAGLAAGQEQVRRA